MPSETDATTAGGVQEMDVSVTIQVPEEVEQIARERHAAGHGSFAELLLDYANISPTFVVADDPPEDCSNVVVRNDS